MLLELYFFKKSCLFSVKITKTILIFLFKFPQNKEKLCFVSVLFVSLGREPKNYFSTTEPNFVWIEKSFLYIGFSEKYLGSLLVRPKFFNTLQLGVYLIVNE